MPMIIFFPMYFFSFSHIFEFVFSLPLLPSSAPPFLPFPLLFSHQVSPRRIFLLPCSHPSISLSHLPSSFFPSTNPPTPPSSSRLFSHIPFSRPQPPFFPLLSLFFVFVSSPHFFFPLWPVGKREIVVFRKEEKKRRGRKIGSRVEVEVGLFRE